MKEFDLEKAKSGHPEKKNGKIKYLNNEKRIR